MGREGDDRTQKSGWHVPISHVCVGAQGLHAELEESAQQVPSLSVHHRPKGS